MADSLARERLRPARRQDPAGRPAPRPRRRPFLVPYAPLILIVLFNLGVFVWLLAESLKPNNEFLTSSPWQPPTHWAWSNFASAWRDANIGGFFANSALVSIGASVLSLVAAVPAAYALARFPSTKAAAVIRQLFFVGLLMPSVVLIIPLYFELSAAHLLDSRSGLVLVYAGLSMPFTVWYLASFFGALPRELEEAAYIDGASVPVAFLRAFLPNAASGLFAVFVVNFLWAWNEFFYALTFLNSQGKFTVALGLFNLQTNAEYGANWVVLFAGMLIGTVPVLLMYGLLSEQITKAMGQGALKG